MSSAIPRDAPGTTELGDGFIYVRRPSGEAATLAPHLQGAGVCGMLTPASVNARDETALRRWLQQWGFAAGIPIAGVNQVHGKSVVRMPAGSKSSVDADGMWSDAPRVVLAVKAADCAPVWLADEASKRFALVHAGWRGVWEGVLASAVEALVAAGTAPEILTVAIGPHLQSCCFEVGPDVAALFSSVAGAVLAPSTLKAPRQRSDGSTLDLSAVMRDRLCEIGVRGERIFISSACTRCHPEMFHSYRRNGGGGPLMAAVAMRRE